MNILDFKVKVNKIRFEANDKTLEKINQDISLMEKRNVEKCEEMLQDGKKLLLKLLILIQIADKEENG